MRKLRNLSATECEQLKQRGCHAETWDKIFVCDTFNIEQLRRAQFRGQVEIGHNTRIENSFVANYILEDEVLISGVSRLECRHSSAFGQGVEVACINENGGRSVLIYEGLSAQTAYIWSMMRHRKTMCDNLQTMVQNYADSNKRELGRVGRGSKIISSNIIRECDIRENVSIEGVSLLENGTILNEAQIGVDVIARDFIFAENALVDSAAQLKRCFVGECAIVASSFAAQDCLIFSSSHLENGEAASIFAGPYTVSHHRSSLLIAGMFSFFNAGSGSNQSNHLFKSGAVHQAIHARGVKFASGAYVMAPAREGAFTMVKGSHSRHHDTAAFPFSYLIEDADGRSTLMPGANLTSYGTKRDIEKWGTRDKRKIKRDIINYEEYNPTMTAAMLKGVNAINSLLESGEKDEYVWERVTIRSSQLKRGLSLYNKAIAASLGSMLKAGGAGQANLDELLAADVYSRWIDLAGAFFPLEFVEQTMDEIESGALKLEDIDVKLQSFAANYSKHACSYSLALLGQILSRVPSAEDIAKTIEAADASAQELEKLRLTDLRRDNNLQMAVGYGNDYEDAEIREADFKCVRDL